MDPTNLDFGKLSNEGLLVAKAALEVEIRSRGLRFGVGEIGEQLAIAYFRDTPGLPTLLESPRGAKYVDAISRDGKRYSIKSVQHAKKTGAVYPDEQDPDRQVFEYLLIVQLDRNLQLASIHRFDWEQFLKVRAWDKRMNAWYVPISQLRLAVGEELFNSRKGTLKTAGKEKFGA